MISKENFEITDKLALLICNKRIEYGNHDFSQTKELIKVPTHWAEGMHEIAHWIVCDPNSRELENLGLPVREDISNVRMQKEEYLARLVTKFLLDKFAKSPDPIEIDYVKSMYNNCEILEKRGKLKRNKALKKAYSLFLKHTENIEINEEV